MHGLTALGLLGFTASAGALDLTPNEPARDLAPHLSYVRADDLSLDSVAAVAALPQSAFAPLPGGQMDFGVLSGTVWLALDIANRGAEPSRWRLVTDLLWADLVIYQERHGALVPLLRTAQSDDFADRPIDYRFLAADFELDGGEVSRLLIARGSLKRAGMTLTIETAATFAAERRRDDAATAAVYAALVFAILFAALQYAVQREGVQLAYLGFTTSATLALAQDEGNLGQHLPSDWAMTGYYATLVALTVFTVQFARTFLRTSEITPRIDRVLLCLPAATLVTVAGSWLRVPFFVVVQNFPLLAAVLLSFGTGLYAYLRGRPTVRFYLVAWISVALGLLIGEVAADGGSLPYAVATHAYRLGLLLDVLMFLLAMADQSRETERERHAVLERELGRRMRQQALAEQLRGAEAAHLDALLRAAQHAARLASTTHDLRQPLHALAVTIDRLPREGGVDAAALARLAQSVAALERASADVLERTAASPTATAPDAPSFPVQLVLENIALMFRDEAETNGWRVRCRDCAAHARGEALHVIRIIGTLIERVVARAGRGALLVGCRRRAGRLRIYVGASAGGLGDDAAREAVKLASELHHELSTARGARGARLWTLDLELATP